MREIKDRRNLTAKHYQLDGGRFEVQIHTKPIHYFNKLGVGDGDKRFRELDWTLSWDEERRGWYFEYNNFIPFIPEYSDKRLDFRDLCKNKDKVISFTPICGSVKGRLVKAEELESEGLRSLTDANCIVYDNAFGKGQDLVIYFIRTGIVKAVRMREYEEVDHEFHFKVDIPEDVTLIRKGNTNTYELDKDGEKLLDSDKVTVLKYGDGEESYFKCFKAWSGDTTIVIPAKMQFTEDGIILTKIISSETIKALGGVIFTDTTTTYYPSADGWFGRQSFSGWASFKSGGGSDWGPDATGSLNAIQYYNTLNLYRHGYFSFDTSAIPDTDTITAATLNLYTTGKSATLSPASVVVNGTGAITAGNFFNRGTTAWSDVVANVDIPTNAYKAWTFNSTGLAGISKTGTTTLITANSNYELANSDPGGNFEYNCYFSEDSGTSRDPYLSVTYAPSATDNSLFFGLGI